MRHARAVRERRLRRADVEARVDLKRVAADDLARQPLGAAQRDLGLAGPGRSDER
jgi:hypothetical protein